MMERLRNAARRLLMILSIWGVLTGATVIKCSSDPGGLGTGDDPPVAADAFYTVAVNGTVTGFMKATASSGNLLTYAIVAGPGQGSLQGVDGKTGRFTYVPSTVGVDSFSFRASDGLRVSNVAVVTIQIFDAVQETAATKTAGALQVADDPMIPGAAIVLWDDGRGTLQRIWRGQPVPGETLAMGVRTFSVDPLEPATIIAAVGDRHAIISTDGGSRWHERNALVAPCLIRGDSTDPSTPVPRTCPLLPEGVTMAGADDFGGDLAGAVISLAQDSVRAGAWRLAISGARTVVLQTRDGGISWMPMRELEVGDLRLAACQERSLCLLDRNGIYLWRFDTDK